jgi:hypothetical protein
MLMHPYTRWGLSNSTKRIAGGAIVWESSMWQTNKGRVTRGVALPFTLKSILTQKEEFWKLKYNFTIQKYNLQKNPLKKRNPKSFKILQLYN